MDQELGRFILSAGTIVWAPFVGLLLQDQPAGRTFASFVWDVDAG